MTEISCRLSVMDDLEVSTTTENDRPQYVITQRNDKDTYEIELADDDELLKLLAALHALVRFRRANVNAGRYPIPLELPELPPQ